MLKNKIDELLIAISKYFYDSLIFNNSQNKHAIVAEIQSNLTIYLRSEEFLNDMYLHNIVEKNTTLEQIIEDIVFENNTDLIEKIIELSFINNLTINKISNNKKEIDCIANSQVNTLLAADGIQFVDNDKEIIISYASTSYEMKRKDNKVLAEINDAFNLLRENDKLLLLNIMSKYKNNIYQTINNSNAKYTFLEKLIEISEMKREILTYIKKLDNKSVQDKTKETILKKVFKDIDKKNYSFEEASNKKSLLEKSLQNLDKKIKISISDSTFNTKEMFKIFLEIRDKIKNNEIKSLVLENIKTNTTIVFNKEKLKLFNQIFGEKFEKLQNVFIAKEHYKFQESSLLEELFNDTYIEHFNINAVERLDRTFITKTYQELKDTLNKNKSIFFSNPLKNIIIEKSYNENFQQLTNNYFSKLFVHLKNIKIFYDVQNVFEIENDQTYSNDKFLKEIDKMFKINKNSDELDIILVLKFIKETYDLNNNDKDDLNKHILSLVTKYLIDKINYLIEVERLFDKNQISVIKEAIKNNFSNNDLLYILNNDEDKIFIEEKNLLINYSSNDDIIEEMSYGSILSSLNLENEFLEKFDGEDRISSLYFKDFIENNDAFNEKEKDKLVDNFLEKTFGGNKLVAVEHAINDTIVETKFAHLQNEFKKRVENFFLKNESKKEKHIIIVVDYDNDGTMAKLAAEKLKEDFLNGLGNYYKNSDNVHIVYTQNANGVRGLTFNDVEDILKGLNAGKKDILLITADNGTSNVEEIEKIMNNQEIINNDNKKIQVSYDNILISDHHPMEHNTTNEIKNFYVKNNENVFLFNPLYTYSLDDNKNYILKESNLKSISGAASFIAATKFLVKDNKKTLDYLENISKISNIMDYVDIEHAEISSQGFISEINSIAKRINILQKFTIYFYNTLNTFDFNTIKNKEDFIHQIENLPEPLNNLNLVFINNLLENNVYFNDLFDKRIKNKNEVLKNLFKDLINLQSDYVKTVFKDENTIENEINPNIIRLIKIFNDNTFTSLLTDFKYKLLLNKTNDINSKEFNIKTINKNDVNDNRIIMFIDQSVPTIPRKLMMDLLRSEINKYKGVYLFGAINDGIYSGSARINGKSLLTDLSLKIKEETIKPQFFGHSKAAGFKIPVEDIKKIEQNEVVIDIKEDTNTLTQSFVFTDIKDFSTTINSTNLINNKKTGGLEFKYLISFDNMKNVGIGIEHLYSLKLGKLNDKDVEKNIEYKNVIKEHKNYQIIMDYKSNLKLNISGVQLLEIIKLINKKENFFFEFKYFNNLFMLDSLVSEKEFNKIVKSKNVFNFDTVYEKDTIDVIKYKEKIDSLKLLPNKEHSIEFIKEKLIENEDFQSNVLYYEIDIKKLKDSKKQNVDKLPFLEDFKDVLNSFGFYNGEYKDMKNIKEFISGLEEYYDLYYKNSKKINFLITDTETNGLQSPLTQVGFVSLEGEIINEKWTLKSFKNFTTVIKYDENFGVSPAIKNLTKIDESLLLDYGTDFKHLGKVLLPILPKEEDTILIAHNLPFDSGILKKHPDINFSDYIKNVKKLDTARISRELNTAGSYQLMTKLYITDDQVKEPLYLGVVPDNLNAINAKITNKMKNEGTTLEFVTIKGDIINWNNEKVTVTKHNGITQTYYGRIVPKDGNDTRLFAVEQNIYNMFLLEAKKLIKNNNKFNLDEKLLNEINDYIKNNVFEENWNEIEPSGKISKEVVMNIINKNFILPNYKNSLLLTLKNRKFIWNNISFEISLYKNINRILDNRKLADKFLEIYTNNDLTKIEKIKLYKTDFVKLFENLNKNSIENDLIKTLNKIDVNNIDETSTTLVDKEIFKLCSKTENNYIKLETFLLKNENIKKMMINIFDKNSKLNLIYNNTRQQKEFFKVFVKNINEIDEKFLLQNLSKEEFKNKIQTYIKDSVDFNNLKYISFNDKVDLFKEFLVLNENSNFKLSIHELHNNFNAFGDVSLESLVLPKFYLDRLNDYKKEEKVNIIKNVYFDSNLTDLSSNLRKTMLNTASNQLMYFLNVHDDNLKINKNNSITINLRSDKYNVDKIITNDELLELFPKNYNEIMKLISKYQIEKNNDNKKEIKNELYSLFMFNSDIDLSLNYEIKKIDDKIKTIAYLNKVIIENTTLLKSLERFKDLDDNQLEVTFNLFKVLHKELVNRDLEEKDTDVIFSNKSVSNFKKTNNFSKIDNIELREGNRKCVLTFSDEDKKTRRKEFTTREIISFIRRIARINSLVPRMEDEKEFDIQNFDDLYSLKSFIQKQIESFVLIHNNVASTLNVDSIKKENIKESIISFYKKYSELELTINSAKENNKMEIKEILDYIEKVSIMYVLIKDIFEKSNELSQKLYDLTGLCNGNSNIILNNNEDSEFIKDIKLKIKQKTEELEEKNKIKIGFVNKTPSIGKTTTLKKVSAKNKQHDTLDF